MDVEPGLITRILMGLGLYKLGRCGTVRIEVLMVGDGVAHRRWGVQNQKIKREEIVRKKPCLAALRGLKAQQVQSPGQRPGYHVPIPYAL